MAAKWEYLEVNMPTPVTEKLQKFADESRAKKLNELGAEGWELVQVIGTGRYCFKRLAVSE